MLLLLLPGIFFGAITYLITHSVIWALIIGSAGWIVIAFLLWLIPALTLEVRRSMRLTREAKARRAKAGLSTKRKNGRWV